MSEFKPVSTVAELELLDQDDILAGYRAALDGAAEPGSDKSRGYWHGWRNGAADKGRIPFDQAMHSLVGEFVRRQRAN